MNTAIVQILSVVMLVLLVSVVFLNVTKRNITAVMLLAIQSCAVSIAIFASAWYEQSLELFFAGLFTLAIKGIFASAFFRRVIVKYSLAFSGKTYLNTPLTLLVAAVLVGVAYSQLFQPWYALLSSASVAAALKGSLGAFFVALLLMINKKGALSELIGILSLENTIILIALLLGLRHNLQLETAITFDITVWICIAAVYLNLLYRQFGSLDVSALNRLKE